MRVRWRKPHIERAQVEIHTIDVAIRSAWARHRPALVVQARTLAQGDAALVDAALGAAFTKLGLMDPTRFAEQDDPYVRGRLVGAMRRRS